MSLLDPQPAAPEKEVGWFKKTIDSAKTWFRQSVNFGFHWLVLLTAIAVLSLDAWFIGLVALAWTHAAPAVKWYYGVGRDTKRNLRWMLGRFGIFAATAGVYLWLGFDEGFDMALILLVLFGIAARLILKRDWTLLGAIVIGVLMGGEYGNGVSIGIALFASALVEYERRKAAYAAKQARMANTSQRSAHQPASAAHGRASVYVTGEYGQAEGMDPYATSAYPAQPRTDGLYADYPPAPPHMPFLGARGGQEDVPGEDHTSGSPERLPRPEYLPPTGSGRGEETEERPTTDLRRPRPPVESSTGTHQVPEDFPAKDGPVTGLHTTEFHVPEQQDGSPVRRRRVLPPEGYTPPQG